MRANVLMVKARTRFLIMKDAVNILKKFIRSPFFKPRLRYLKVRAQIESFHMLVKGKLLKERTMTVFAKVKILQFAAFHFLFRCRWYYKKLTATNTITRVVRGMLRRLKYSEQVAYLRAKKRQRIAVRVVTFLQWRWRSRLVSVRYNELRETTRCIQRWYRSRQERLHFLRLVHCIIWAQCRVRRILAINKVSTDGSKGEQCPGNKE